MGLHRGIVSYGNPGACHVGGDAVALVRMSCGRPFVSQPGESAIANGGFLALRDSVHADFCFCLAFRTRDQGPLSGEHPADVAELSALLKSGPA